MKVHCTGAMWDLPEHTVGRERGKGKGLWLLTPTVHKTGASVRLREPYPFSFGVRSLGATSFRFNKPFPLQNCFAHSLDVCPERGKDPCGGNTSTPFPNKVIGPGGHHIFWRRHHSIHYKGEEKAVDVALSQPAPKHFSISTYLSMLSKYLPFSPFFLHFNMWSLLYVNFISINFCLGSVLGLQNGLAVPWPPTPTGPWEKTMLCSLPLQCYFSMHCHSCWNYRCQVTVNTGW